MYRNSYRKRPALPAPCCSARLLVRLAPEDIAMFRFLLEAYDNLASFTVLERRTALLKVFFSPHQENAVRQALTDMGHTVALHVQDWPFPSPV